jgi:hypothetical protein
MDEKAKCRLSRHPRVHAGRWVKYNNKYSRKRSSQLLFYIAK